MERATPLQRSGMSVPERNALANMMREWTRTTPTQTLPPPPEYDVGTVLQGEDGTMLQLRDDGQWYEHTQHIPQPNPNGVNAGAGGPLQQEQPGALDSLIGQEGLIRDLVDGEFSRAKDRYLYEADENGRNYSPTAEELKDGSFILKTLLKTWRDAQVGAAALPWWAGSAIDAPMAALGNKTAQGRIDFYNERLRSLADAIPVPDTGSYTGDVVAELGQFAIPGAAGAVAGNRVRKGVEAVEEAAGVAKKPVQNYLEKKAAEISGASAGEIAVTDPDDTSILQATGLVDAEQTPLDQRSLVGVEGTGINAIVEALIDSVRGAWRGTKNIREADASGPTVNAPKPKNPKTPYDGGAAASRPEQKPNTDPDGPPEEDFDDVGRTEFDDRSDFERAFGKEAADDLRAREREAAEKEYERTRERPRDDDPDVEIRDRDGNRDTKAEEDFKQNFRRKQDDAKAKADDSKPSSDEFVREKFRESFGKERGDQYYEEATGQRAKDDARADSQKADPQSEPKPDEPEPEEPKQGFDSERGKTQKQKEQDASNEYQERRERYRAEQDARDKKRADEKAKRESADNARYREADQKNRQDTADRKARQARFDEETSGLDDIDFETRARKMQQEADTAEDAYLRTARKARDGDPEAVRAHEKAKKRFFEARDDFNYAREKLKERTAKRKEREKKRADADDFARRKEEAQAERTRERQEKAKKAREEQNARYERAEEERAKSQRTDDTASGTKSDWKPGDDDGAFSKTETTNARAEEQNKAYRRARKEWTRADKAYREFSEYQRAADDASGPAKDYYQERADDAYGRYETHFDNTPHGDQHKSIFTARKYKHRGREGRGTKGERRGESQGDRNRRKNEEANNAGKGYKTNRSDQKARGDRFKDAAEKMRKEREREEAARAEARARRERDEERAQAKQGDEDAREHKARADDIKYRKTRSAAQDFMERARNASSDDARAKAWESAAYAWEQAKEFAPDAKYRKQADEQARKAREQAEAAKKRRSQNKGRSSGGSQRKQQSSSKSSSSKKEEAYTDSKGNKPNDGDQVFKTDDQGYVLEGGKPRVFADQKQAGKWMIANAKNTEQLFEIVNHPKGSNFAVRQRVNPNTNTFYAGLPPALLKQLGPDLVSGVAVGFAAPWDLHGEVGFSPEYFLAGAIGMNIVRRKGFVAAKGGFLEDKIAGKALDIWGNTPYLRGFHPTEGLRAEIWELRRQATIDERAIQQQAADGIRERISKLSKDEQEMAVDWVEQGFLPGSPTEKLGGLDNIPDHVKQIAFEAAKEQERIGADLVKFEALDPVAYEAARGKYLRRYYSSKPKGNDWLHPIKNFKLRVEFAMGRGKEHTIALKKGIEKGDVVYAVKHFKTGHKKYATASELAGLRAKDYDVGAKYQVRGVNAKGKKMTIWRDYNPTERRAMGEIRHLDYRMGRGTRELARDYGIAKMLYGISKNPEFASTSKTKPDWELVPDTRVGGTGIKLYGALGGKYVDPEVFRSLKNTINPMNARQIKAVEMFWKAHRAAITYFKVSKTAYNLDTNVANVLSNIQVAMQHAPFGFREIPDAIKAFRDPKQRSEMIKAGLSLNENINLGDQWSKIEREIYDEMDERTMWSKLATWYMQGPIPRFYNNQDAIFKVAAYLSARKEGKSAREAVDHAHEYFYDYSAIPIGAKIIRDIASPFFSYNYLSYAMTAKGWMRYPHRMLAAYGLWTAWDIYGYASQFPQNPGAQAEFEETYKRRYMKGRTSNMNKKNLRMPFSEEDEARPGERRASYWNAERITPGGLFGDFTNNTDFGPSWIPQVIGSPVGSVPTVVNAVELLYTGKDLYYGGDIYPYPDRKLFEGGPNFEDAANLRAGFNRLAKTWTPGFMTKLYNIGNSFVDDPNDVNALQEFMQFSGRDYVDRQMDPKKEFLRFLGIRTEDMNVDEAYEFTFREFKSEYNKAKWRAKGAHRDARQSDKMEAEKLRSADEAGERWAESADRYDELKSKTPDYDERGFLDTIDRMTDVIDGPLTKRARTALDKVLKGSGLKTTPTQPDS